MKETFLKECLQDLKRNNFCYVYTEQQVKEVLSRCKLNVRVIPNECGFTINVKRGVKKDE